MKKKEIAKKLSYRGLHKINKCLKVIKISMTYDIYIIDEDGYLVGERFGIKVKLRSIATRATSSSEPLEVSRVSDDAPEGVETRAIQRKQAMV